MEYFTDTDIGKYREKNADYLYDESNLFIVASSMRGHRAGEVSSVLTVKNFIKDFNHNLKSRSK